MTPAMIRAIAAIFCQLTGSPKNSAPPTSTSGKVRLTKGYPTVSGMRVIAPIQHGPATKAAANAATTRGLSSTRH